MSEKENVIIKVYDLLKYIIPQLAKFPRDQKFILADRIENNDNGFRFAQENLWFSKKMIFYYTAEITEDAESISIIKKKSMK